MTHTSLSDLSFDSQVIGGRYCITWRCYKPLWFFGETVLVFIPIETRQPGTKLSPRADEDNICGLEEIAAEYRVYIPSKRQVVRSQDVLFERKAPNVVESPSEEPPPMLDTASSSDSDTDSEYSVSDYDDKSEQSEGEGMDTAPDNTAPSPTPTMSGHFSDEEI